MLRVRELMKRKDRKSILMACLSDQHSSFSLNWASSVKGNLSLTRKRDNRESSAKKDM